MWDELASLFLDTDYLGIVGPERMARRIAQAGYSPDEVEAILLDEVLPAFAFNLRSIAGEWPGWHEDFLRERIAAARGWSALRRQAEGLPFRRAILRDWKRIRRHLS